MAEVAALGSALLEARQSQERAALERACSAARTAYHMAERAGASEAASAFLYIEEALVAMTRGDIPATPEGWRQIEAAWRSAGSASESRPVACHSAAPSAGQVVVISGHGVGALLAPCYLEPRLVISEFGSLADATRAIGHADVVVVDWSADSEFTTELCALCGLPARPRWIAVGPDDDFETRYRAAALGVDVYLSRREAPRQLSEAVSRGLASRSRRSVLFFGSTETLLRVERALAARSFDVVHCTDERRLPDELQSSGIDALVLDSSLGAPMVGNLCRMLRGAPRWQDLPIVAVRGGDASLARAIFETGADDVLALDGSDVDLPYRLEALIERAERAQAQASCDALTGLLTRRAFIAAAEARLAEARRSRKYLSVCLIDVDHFKQVNDRFGHPAGDEVLATFGNLLNSRLRREDVRGRWGGEEFIVVFFDEWAESARQVLARVITEFSTRTFIGSTRDCFSVTASAGIATFPVDGKTLEELITSADAKLYAAKAAGRNRTVVWR